MAQLRTAPRSPLEMDPPLRLPEREHMHPYTDQPRRSRLELQQQLPPDRFRIVVKEFLQIQHVRSEPGRIDGSYDSPYTALGTFVPVVGAGLRAREYLFARIPHARPEPGQQIDVRAPYLCARTQ